jgi:shikimate kinase
MPAQLVLVGAPGAGKTTVGRLVAERLGLPFTDTDEVVEQVAGMPVSQIFVSQGEAHFRELERTAVAESVTAGTGVVALGGGAVMDAGTRDLLTAVPTVWLRVGLAGALARVGMNQARPLLLGNVRGRLLALLEERAPLYEQVSRARVDTDGLEPAAVADAVVALVAAGGTP